MAQDMDWDDIANMWWTHFEDMQTTPNPQQGRKRGRSRSRTPVSRKRSDRAPSRAKVMQPRKLTFSSARTRSRSRSASEPRKKQTWGKAAFYEANKGKSPAVIEKAWRKTAQGKRNQATADRLFKLSKVRHKLTRKDARKTMPRGKPYARRTTKRPKGAYRGAVMPRWAKGETKHILMNDNCLIDGVSVPGNQSTTPYTAPSSETVMSIGDLKSWSLNPCLQGNGQTERNGRSIDGTYLRIQGHIRNAISGQTEGAPGKCYVRMIVVACKGQVATPASANNTTDITYSATRLGAPFRFNQLFRKIDGSVVPFAAPSGTTGDGAAALRTLQLPINKGLFTVLADQKFQLSNESESFGSSDRLFDLKMKLKQRTQFGDANCNSFEKNQLVFCVMTVDPQCGDAAPSLTPIRLEFESKYSYKDL